MYPSGRRARTSDEIREGEKRGSSSSCPTVMETSVTDSGTGTNEADWEGEIGCAVEVGTSSVVVVV